MKRLLTTFVPIAAAALLSHAVGFSAEIHIGTAAISITPDQPVALTGQMRTRISERVASPLIASVVALESRRGEESLDAAVMVACDLVAVRSGISELVRERVETRLPGFDTSRLFLSATHTHTAPVLTEGIYLLPEQGIMRPTDYVKFLADRIAEAVVRAWESRRPGAVGWGLGHAVVGHNRRSVYADGHAQMYGRTNLPDFRGIEGSEDHGVEVLFFWDEKQTLIATAINVACPSQEVEGDRAVDADFWHPVREALRARYGKDLVVLGWTGAAGDQSPHLMFRKRAEERMRKLRGLTRLEEISRRIVRGWEEAHAGASQEPWTDVTLIHHVETVELPRRQVTADEYRTVKNEVEKYSQNPENLRRVVWLQDVLTRYEQQQAKTTEPYHMELHAIRLGDVAIATNPFELFTEFGIQMKSRSPALQTFVVQLAGPGTYVPTAEAARGGGYSAIVASNEVGPEGGQVLTEKTVTVLNALWTDD